jgi:tetratricopeptide (TPR) repeat protein
MRRLLAAVLLVTVAAGAAVAQGRDPGYDRILDAYKKKRWPEFDTRSAEFLVEKPDYKFAHSVRFMIAESYRQRKRLREAVDAYEAYLARHADANLADRSRGALISTLNQDGRSAEALAKADEYLEKWPEGAARPRVAWERAVALEGLRRFADAAAAYDGIEGSFAERARYRTGVAWFRGGEYEKAKAALEAFLERFPASSWERSARDYLYRTDAPYSKIVDGVVKDYEGKYAGEDWIAVLLGRLPKLRAEALGRIREAVGGKVPETFLIRLADAGASQAGLFASTRVEVVGGEPRQVLILFTESLSLGNFDLDSTLTHELYHALQRERLGDDHYRTPKWVREGSAIFVAGQGPSRIRMIAADVGRRTSYADPMSRLVNGLDGRHTLNDYAEDVGAFLATEARHGPEKTKRLLQCLLETPDVAAAVRKALGEDLATFERLGAEYTRKILAPLLEKGRDAVHAAARHLGAGRPDAALRALPKDPGAYAPAVVYMRALAHLNANRPEETLRVVREEYYPTHRTFAPLTDNAVLLEVKALKALGHEDYRKVGLRARMDLEPMSAYRALMKVLED